MTIHAASPFAKQQQSFVNKTTANPNDSERMNYEEMDIELVEFDPSKCMLFSSNLCTYSRVSYKRAEFNDNYASR